MGGFSPDNLKTYICTHVFEGTHPVLLIAHEKDGDWIFVCGQPHKDTAESYRVVGVGHLTARDPSLNQCADLPAGHEAERSAPGQPWMRTDSDARAF